MTSAALRRVLEQAWGPAHSPQPRERAEGSSAEGRGLRGVGPGLCARDPGAERNPTAPRRLFSVLSGREQRQLWSPRRTAMNLAPQGISLALGGAVRGWCGAGGGHSWELWTATSTASAGITVPGRSCPTESESAGSGAGTGRTRVHQGRPHSHPEPPQPEFTFQEVKTSRAQASKQ